MEHAAIRSADIALGDQILKVYWIAGECFAIAADVAAPLQMSAGGFRGHLSKTGIKTVKNEEWQSVLNVSAKTTFITRDALKMLLRDRIRDVAVINGAIAVLDAPAAFHLQAPAAPDDSAVSVEPIIVPQINAFQRVPVAPVASIVLAAPVPAAAAAEVIIQVPVAQQLKLPTAEGWYNDEDLVVGKIYALPDFDQSDELKAQLKAFKTFWTAEDSDGRRSEKLSAGTIDKRESRALLYLGFLRLLRATDDPKVLTLSAFLNHKAVYAYIEWLQRTRECQLGTLVEQLSAIVTVVKYLYRNAPADIVANNFASVDIVARLRELRNRFQAKQRLEPKTQQDLEDDGRWLSWDDFGQAIVDLQVKFDEAHNDDDPDDKTSRLLHDLVMLRIYQASPSRSSEVRCLQFTEWGELLQLKSKKTVTKWVGDSRINVITQRPDSSSYTIFLADYKTFKHNGVDEILISDETFPELVDCLTLYLADYREWLLPRHEQHRFLFMTSAGKPFGIPDFSKYLGNLLFRLTGRRATSNILRSSFVTGLLSSPEGNDPAVRESAAKLMHHSERQQMSTYDRRHPTEKKKLAQSVLGKRIQREPKEPSDEESDENKDVHFREPKEANVRFSRGDVVVIPYVDNETRADTFRLARVYSCDSNSVRLMALICINDDEKLFKADIGRIWDDSPSACYHCDVDYDSSSNVYKLRTTEDDILALLE